MKMFRTIGAAVIAASLAITPMVNAAQHKERPMAQHKERPLAQKKERPLAQKKERPAPGR